MNSFACTTRSSGQHHLIQSKSICAVPYKDVNHSFSPVAIAHISTRSLARGVVLLKTLLLWLREVLCVFDLTDRDALVVALMVDGLDS
jgi:hypothetical protein